MAFIFLDAGIFYFCEILGNVNIFLSMFIPRKILTNI